MIILGVRGIWSGWRGIKTEFIFFIFFTIVSLASTIQHLELFSMLVHTNYFDDKPEMGLISPDWGHCWYDDFMDIWQRVL